MDEGLGGGFQVRGNTGSGSTLTFTQSGLTPGLQYHFLVAAINIVGTGADSISTPVIAGTVPEPP